MTSSKGSKSSSRENPYLRANFFSKFLFLWTRHIFKIGLHHPFGVEDVYDNMSQLDSKKLTDEFNELWQIELKHHRPNIWRVILKIYGWKVLPLCILYSILEIFTHAVQPLLLRGLMSHFSKDPTNTSKHMAYVYATGMVMCNLVNSLCFNAFVFRTCLQGVRVRLACSGLIYQRCLQCPLTSNTADESSTALFLLFRDLSQIETAFMQIHNLWKGPIEVIVFGTIMWITIGWPAVIGIIFLIAFIPLQGLMAKLAGYYRREMTKCENGRGKMVAEVLQAIQVIKMYAWENFFVKSITVAREKALRFLRSTMMINAICQCTVNISTTALVLSLLTYVYTQQMVTSKRVFIATLYFSTLNQTILRMWTLATISWSETFIFMKRANEFILSNQKDTRMGYQNLGFVLEKEMEGKEIFECESVLKRKFLAKKGLCLQSVKASWGKAIQAAAQGETKKIHIDNISTNIEEGQFVGIIGNVGSGKSSLLLAMLGELDIKEGKVIVNGAVSYASQDAWIFEASIRDNIIFVEKFDEKRYQSVIHACELERDIELMPCGDSTIVGERGISLSGGQKARINLARAVYRQADIYLLDDPLSAVDSYVGKRLMEKCFLKFLEGKIRILVTHHVQHMENVDHIILMNGGTIEKQGSFDDFKMFIEGSSHIDNSSCEINSKSTIFPQNGLKNVKSDKKCSNGNVKNDSNDQRQEHQIQGSINFRTYLAYFQALECKSMVLVVFSLFILARISQSLMDIYVTKWSIWEDTIHSTGIEKSNDAEDNESERRNTLLVYGIIALVTTGVSLIRSFGFFIMCVYISRRIHKQLIKSILRAYMIFFNLNSTGRILNRFCSDTWKTDMLLPQAMYDSFSFFADIIAVLLTVAWSNYWLLIPMISIIGIILICRSLYLRSGRNLKRVESITCSFVNSQVTQTFQGLTTIRALGAASQMKREFHKHLDFNTSACFTSIAANRAFCLWMDILSGLNNFIIIFSFLMFENNFQSGQVGLSITQSLKLLIICQWGIRGTTDMENYMTCFERIMEYISNPKEANTETSKELNLPKDWPSTGHIRFENVRLRYSEDSPYMLKGINLDIKPMEKIGIVGRTGAGKSSIIQAIFRLAINEGLVEIDGFDIANLGLCDLRSRISIIPQEPVLFSGTLRQNLDPYQQKTDEEMWQVLADVKVKPYILSIGIGLDYLVYDGGANFSTGQRQLICLARAILHHNKILIMDEATANVDPHTDELIQRTIRTKFEKCTVLTIAHRIQTVMDNDRILVMDSGQAVEFDHPYALLQNDEGYFYNLIEKLGKRTAQQLKLLAKQSYDKLDTNRK